MLKKKIKNGISKIIYIIITWKFIFKKIPTPKERTLLIVKLDAIGDYVLFRNFLEIIRKSEKYKNHKITLCGNECVKELSEGLDSEYVDDFIWIDRNKIFRNPLYFFRIISSVAGQYEEIIQPTFSREFIVDILIKYSGANKRIGFTGDLNNISVHDKCISDKWYTELINVDPETIFEFYKNKSFFSHILNKSLVIKTPSIDIHELPSKYYQRLPDSFILLFPGGQQSFKRWPAKNFKVIGEYLTNKYKTSVVICGGKNDVNSAKIIHDKNDKIHDLTGKTNLIQLVDIISRAKLVLSNDTGGAHISTALNIPTIILSQFTRYLRFVPYPKEISEKIICLTPNIYRNMQENDLVEKFKNGSNEDISLISTKEVIESIENFLKAN